MKRIVFLVITFIFLSCKESQKDNDTYNAIEKLTHLVDLQNKTFDLSSLKGKKVVLNYWATWCSPCKEEMPSMLSAKEKLKNENYLFVLVSDEPVEEITAFKKKHSYDFVFLKSIKPLNNQKIYALPTTFVFNSSGKKVDKIVGAITWDTAKMIDKLKKIK